MAKAQWDTNYLTTSFDATLLSITSNRTKAVYEIDDGTRVVLSGTKLKAESGNSEELGSGTVTKVVFKDGDGNTTMTVRGKFEADDIGDALGRGGSNELYYQLLFEGDDIIDGNGQAQSIWGGAGDDEIRARGGADSIGSGDGDDRMSGGKGSDTFYFYEDDRGDDVILDFDIKGLDADKLYISSSVEVEYIRSVNGKKDTLLDLDTGGSILLKNIKRADFIDYWEVT